jgi:hypothetical protein
MLISRPKALPGLRAVWSGTASRRRLPIFTSRALTGQAVSLPGPPMEWFRENSPWPGSTTGDVATSDASADRGGHEIHEFSSRSLDGPTTTRAGRWTQFRLNKQVQGVISGPSLDHPDSRDADDRPEHHLRVRLHQRRLCQRAPTPLESEAPSNFPRIAFGRCQLSKPFERLVSVASFRSLCHAGDSASIPAVNSCVMTGTLLS